MPVLMHISDLHRSSDEPISNAELVAAIDRDLARQSHETPQIPPPDALVVSGDLIRGAPLDDPSPDDTIRTQYRQAGDFLNQLTDLLFSGDRSRVAICPGNHDVHWCQARASMEPVPEGELPAHVYQALTTPGSQFRWDWENRLLYRIVDPMAYDGRMDAYWEFIGDFYVETDIKQIPTVDNETLLVELFDRRVLLTAFNSCSLNDCFRRAGLINPETIAKTHLELQGAWEYDLRIAVWHHNIAGPPNADDYLNIDQIHKLIDYGFRLGLHGHQHRSELVLHKLGLPDYGDMAVISAGSLAAGNAELPRGVNRQYNMIQLKDDLAGARVHIREEELGLFGPRRLNIFGGNSFSDVSWQPLVSMSGTSIDSHYLNLNGVINKAEKAFNELDYDRVIALLSPLVSELSDYGRSLITSSASRSGNWKTILKDLYPPTSIGEISVIVKAAVETGNYSLAYFVVEEYGTRLGFPSSQQEELIAWIESAELL